MKKNLYNSIKWVISIGIIVILVYKVGFSTIIGTLRSVNMVYIVPILVINGLLFLSGTINIKLLLDCTGKKVGFSKLLKFNILSWSIGLLSPGKLGEFSLVYFLKKEGVTIGEGTLVAVLDKVISIIVLGALAVSGFFIFFPDMTALKLVLLTAAVLTIMIFFVFTKAGRNLIKKFILRKHSEKFIGFNKHLSFYLREKKGIVMVNLLITLIKWIFGAMIPFILFVALGYMTNFVYVMFITAMLVILSLIPMTISGLGVKEVAAVFLFGQLGIPASVVLSSFIIITIINYLISALAIASK